MLSFTKIRTSAATVIAKFGAVGLLAFVVDIGLFNLLVTVSSAPMENKPVSAKLISAAVATTLSWALNRSWTFKGRGSLDKAWSYILFVAINIVAAVTAAACLYFTHHILGLDSALADNISANIIGVAIGTVIRYVGYSKLVFPDTTTQRADETVPTTVAS